MLRRSFLRVAKLFKHHVAPSAVGATPHSYPNPSLAPLGDGGGLHLAACAAPACIHGGPVARQDALRTSCLPALVFIPLNPSGWAEERRQKRIRAGTCLRRGPSLCLTPLLLSTAGCPQRSRGTQTIGSPFFSLGFFGDAKKSKSPAGARPGLFEASQAFKLARPWTPDRVRDDTVSNFLLLIK